MEPMVRMVNVPRMRVAVAHGQGTTPEADSYEALVAWAGPRGLLEDRSNYLWFGHNNPPPAHGVAEYGYDSMITIGPEVVVTAPLRVGEVAGGWYAVARTSLTQITAMWSRLYAWVEASPYSVADRGLEELLVGVEDDPDHMLLDLWLPVKAPGAE